MSQIDLIAAGHAELARMWRNARPGTFVQVPSDAILAACRAYPFFVDSDSIQFPCAYCERPISHKMRQCKNCGARIRND